MRSRWLVLGVALAGLDASTGEAQGPLSSRVDSLRVGDRTFEKIAGFSWHSPDRSWGDVTHRRVYLTTLRLGRILSAVGGGAIAYTMELVPLAIVERTAPNSEVCWDEPGYTVCRRDRSARVAVGFGGSPIGAKVYWKRSGRVRIQTSGSAGGLYFSSDVPTYNSARLNLALSLGTGVEIVTRTREIVLGYKFHHISNAGFGDINPGLDANVVYLGVIRRRNTR